MFFPTWEEEDQHRNHHVQHQIRIAREIEDQGAQEPLRHEALHAGLGSDDGHHHLVGSLGKSWVRHGVMDTQNDGISRRENDDRATDSQSGMILLVENKELGQSSKRIQMSTRL